MATATLFIFHAQFWEFFFAMPGKHFYEAAVWGNVVAVLPLMVLVPLGFLWHRGIVKETRGKLDKLAAAHERHAVHLKKMLDSLDPETDGGIGPKIDAIEDALDSKTPGGVKDIIDEVHKFTRSGLEPGKND